MESQKIYLAGDQSNGLNAALVSALQNRGVDPSVLACLNGNNGLFGNGNDILALIILFAVFGWGGNGFGGWGNGGNSLGSTTEREMIMSAIQRNGIDINSLASSLNCSVGQVQTAINGVTSQICNLAAQSGQNALQIINSIQAGNQTLSAQIASCCCDIRESVTRMGYDNQIATLRQTETLAGKIDAQTVAMNDKFCQLEKREMQNKIDALREETSTYKTSAMTSQIVAAAVAPINAAISKMQEKIACLPDTVTVPANNGVLVPACVAAQLGLYGPGFGYGAGLGNGSLWA